MEKNNHITGVMINKDSLTGTPAAADLQPMLSSVVSKEEFDILVSQISDINNVILNMNNNMKWKNWVRR